jgi:ribosomal protein S18 acetylase RimI-like enzyme
MIVVPTTEAHWRQLKATRLAALLESPTAFGVTHAQSSANTEEDWRAHAAGRRGVAFFLAFDGDDAVGIAGGMTGGDGQYQLIAMWVQPAYRGSGVAAQLVDAVKARAVAVGHGRVVLDVAPENTPAARFYQKQGFAFLPQRQALASHPHIQVQAMEWLAGITPPLAP